METVKQTQFVKAHHIAIGMLTGKGNQDPARLHPDLAWTIGLVAAHVKSAVRYQGDDAESGARELRSTQVIATIIAMWQLQNPHIGADIVRPE